MLFLPQIELRRAYPSEPHFEVRLCTLPHFQIRLPSPANRTSNCGSNPCRTSNCGAPPATRTSNCGVHLQRPANSSDLRSLQRPPDHDPQPQSLPKPNQAQNTDKPNRQTQPNQAQNRQTTQRNILHTNLDASHEPEHNSGADGRDTETQTDERTERKRGRKEECRSRIELRFVLTAVRTAFILAAYRNAVLIRFRTSNCGRAPPANSEHDPRTEPSTYYSKQI
ncbi:hypothetical protein LR48_Vigan05g166500 [Vigna angularis]|uniref:Uncharacterized protein n=1 Tax=Phaseolus angularis TaxID=3914 RepID=A0A0L9UME8_PHAAN|nr:hypothetical protein LR48_Vigan05g166500 [Vigna angularis]